MGHKLGTDINVCRSAGSERRGCMVANNGMEDRTLQGGEIAGGGADIRKCFSAILRDLVYMLLWAAGCPRGVRRKYRVNLFWMYIYTYLHAYMRGRPRRAHSQRNY